jgi:hypothetical protein
MSHRSVVMCEKDERHGCVYLFTEYQKNVQDAY